MSIEYLTILYKKFDFSNNALQMKKLTANQQGFIPLILTILVIVVAVIVFAYMRVAKVAK